jgi:hypothetical protein
MAFSGVFRPVLAKHTKSFNLIETLSVGADRIWSVLIDRRCPINGQATQDQAQKDWHVQPVAAPYQQVVPANYKHTGFRLRRACSESFVIELRGMWHKYSPR